MLVAMLGMSMRASASSGRTAKVINAKAIGGRPMPIAPLAMPATMKAPAITSICRTVVAEDARIPSCDRPSEAASRSHRHAFRHTIEGLPEADADRIGLHHDLLACADDDRVFGMAQARRDLP